METLSNVLADNQAFTLKDLAIGGDDLIARDFTQGKEVGEVLQKLLDHVIENPLHNNKEDLSAIAIYFL